MKWRKAMHRALLEVLACPECHGPLKLQQEGAPTTSIEDGSLTCASCTERYLIRDGIPRFSPAEWDDVQNFGWQWERFRHTQIDRFNKTHESEKRFRAETGWQPENLKRLLVLDAGCGAGRFSAVAAEWGARVVAVDLAPGAAESCKKKHGGFRARCRCDSSVSVQAPVPSTSFRQGIIFGRAPSYA